MSFRLIRGLVVLVATCLSGCVSISTQSFSDTSSENGLEIRKVTATHRTIIPPFGGRGLTQHSLKMVEDGEGWKIDMGDNNDITAGKALEDLLPLLSLL